MAELMSTKLALTSESGNGDPTPDPAVIAAMDAAWAEDAAARALPDLPTKTGCMCAGANVPAGRGCGACLE